MKDLTDSQLIDMIYENLENADKHMYVNIVLTIIAIIQSVLLIFNLVGVFSFVSVYVLCLIFYLYHQKKSEKYMKTIDELLKELTSRDI